MHSTTETERLLIRDIFDEDLDFIFEGLSHPDVIRYYGVSYHTREAAQSQMDWYKEIENNNTGKWWLIALNKTATVIGAIGFNYYQPQHHRIEIGFWLLPSYQGKSLMFEALNAVVPLATTRWNVHRIEAMVETENIASKKLLTKAGFICDGLLRDYELKDNSYISLEVFSKLF